MKLSKTIIPAAIVSALLFTSTGFAAPAANQISNMTFHSLPAGTGLTAGDIYCYNNPTDVCIANYSSQTVYFSVPLLNQAGPLYPPQWVDVYSNMYYPSIPVTVENSNYQPIFNQPVGNHSIVNITNYLSAASGAGKSQLVVTVRHN